MESFKLEMDCFRSGSTPRGSLPPKSRTAPDLLHNVLHRYIADITIFIRVEKRVNKRVKQKKEWNYDIHLCQESLIAFEHMGILGACTP